MCGLKPPCVAALSERQRVTPCMGVWIETPFWDIGCICDTVTPCMGVWIETYANLNKVNHKPSHPVWVCGLKQPYRITAKRDIMSHPVWVCGLKHQGVLSLKIEGGHTLYGCVD